MRKQDRKIRPTRISAGLLAALAGITAPIWLAGCASPAPTPPPPQVHGLDTYVAGARAYDAGDTDRAQLLLEEAVRENPDLTMARVLLGDLYKKKDDYRHASDQYEAAVKLDPYSSKNYYDLAVVYQFLDRLQEAATAYLKSLTLSPRDLKSNVNLGVVYLAMGRNDDAVKQLEKATQIDPRSGDAWCNYGAALESSGELTKAESAYRMAVELSPDQTIAMTNLAGVLLKQDRGHEAAAVMTEVVKKNDSPQARKRLGDALVLDHRDDEAVIQYDLSLQKNPKYWQAMNQIGLILIRKYENGMTLDENLRLQAVDVWKKSLTLHPGQQQVSEWMVKYEQGGKVLP
jgi:tetratricopeptide (TPR) repeat protein